MGCVQQSVNASVGTLANQTHLKLPDIASLLSRTKLQTDDQRDGRWASLNTTDDQGKLHHSESTTLKGDPGNPLTQTDRIKKARQLMEGHLGTDTTERLIEHWLEGDLHIKLIPDGITTEANQRD